MFINRTCEGDASTSSTILVSRVNQEEAAVNLSVRMTELWKYSCT